MNRTAWLQDRRMQKLSMMKAAELLGMSERQFRRYRERFEEEGKRSDGPPSGQGFAEADRGGGGGAHAALYRRFTRLEREAFPRARCGAITWYSWAQLHAAGLVGGEARGAHRRKRERSRARG